jgi:hypothetical protein
MCIPGGGVAFAELVLDAAAILTLAHGLPGRLGKLRLSIGKAGQHQEDSGDKSSHGHLQKMYFLLFIGGFGHQLFNRHGINRGFSVLIAHKVNVLAVGSKHGSDHARVTRPMLA